LISKLFGKKYILKITDLRPLHTTNIKYHLFKYTINTIPVVHLPNNAMLPLLHKIGYKGQIYVIPNFPFYKNLHPGRLRGKIFKILFVGRLQKHVKGIDLLESIIRFSLLKNKELKFYIVGSLGDGETIINELQRVYPKNIFWTGFIPPNLVENYYNNSHLFIVTSRHETFGSSILEAQLFGLPVIGFNVIGPKELIKTKLQGTLVRPFDIKAFSNAINKYYLEWLYNKKAYNNRSGRLTAYTQNRYRAKKIIEMIVKMFESERNKRHT
jgi:glycosyltransferase involved in cell wall biosynthesis